eukprot:4294088-Pyramimonas_sp.AAC.1
MRGRLAGALESLRRPLLRLRLIACPPSTSGGGSPEIGGSRLPLETRPWPRKASKPKASLHHVRGERRPNMV